MSEEHRVQKAIEAYQSGLSVREVKILMGWSRNYTERVLRGAGVTRPVRGRQHPLLIQKRAAAIRRDLWSRFEGKVSPEPNSGCWLWTGATDRNGYGQLRCDRKSRMATHISVEMSGRAIEAGQVVRHKCDNPACVNPGHLLTGTQADNMADMVSRGRHDWSGLALAPTRLPR